ncbi:MAG: M61 family metallopeptidase [Rhodanobacteraceae bacterium]
MSLPSPCPRLPRPLRLAAALSVALLTVSFAGGALADAADAHVPPPKDIPYPGTITLDVNATNTQQGIFEVHESIPVKPGDMTLLYPKWIPGDHAFNPNTLDKFAGLVITANGKRVPWLRDKYDVYAFKVDVPQGVSTLDLSFQWLAARSPDQGSYLMTNRILDIKWNHVSLYPAGYYTRDITFAPKVTFPEGWQIGTALERVDQSGASHTGNTYTFKLTTYNTLVDSPVYAGKYFKRLDLNPGDKNGNVPVHMDLFAEAPKDLEVTPKELQTLQNIVTQEHDLFESHHYHHYDWLVSVSDIFAMNGLEHHQSSEDGVKANFFTDWKANEVGFGNLLAHEYTHSWNGKFRRPADLWTPNFNIPMGDSKLWVYEGLTQYWGYVITTRAGMWTPEQYRESMAMLAGTYDRDRPGFAWRNIQDTTNDEMIAHRRPRPYRSWQTGEMYYDAGQLVWLDVDCKIRALTHDKDSLDTFAREFFGVDNGSMVTKTYTFDDIVAALNHVAKYNWAQFLRARLDAHTPPTHALAAAGWKLVFTDKPNDFEKHAMKRKFPPYPYSAFPYSIGLSISKHGEINDVRWGGPAFKAGVGSGETLVAVNGQAYSRKVLNDALVAAEKSKAPIKLLLKYQDQFQTIPIAYYGGPQYPHLERIKGAADYLDQIVKAR